MRKSRDSEATTALDALVQITKEPEFPKCPLTACGQRAWRQICPSASHKEKPEAEAKEPGAKFVNTPNATHQLPPYRPEEGKEADQLLRSLACER